MIMALTGAAGSVLWPEYFLGKKRSESGDHHHTIQC